MNLALELVQSGWSYSNVSNYTKLNKSIITREMRKRGNLKARDKTFGNQE